MGVGGILPLPLPFGRLGHVACDVGAKPSRGHWRLRSVRFGGGWYRALFRMRRFSLPAQYHQREVVRRRVVAHEVRHGADDAV